MSRRREEALKAEVAVSSAKLEDRGAELAKAQVSPSQPRTHLSLLAATRNRIKNQAMSPPPSSLHPARFFGNLTKAAASVPPSLTLCVVYKPTDTITQACDQPLHARRSRPPSTQSRADDLAAARAADTESSADRAAREAVVRRLDNERQYLKSQLQSEITCKDELREALATATRQLGDIKVWCGVLCSSGPCHDTTPRRCLWVFF